MTDSPGADDLRAVLAGLARKDVLPNQDELSRLHVCVCVLVDEMKAAGVLPEHIVISLKRIALDAEIQWTNHALFERLIDWCLAHYYAESPDGRE